MPCLLLALLVLLAAPTSATAQASLGGQVVDVAGRPIAHAAIRLPELRRSATTDASGRFVLPELPAGRWQLGITAIGFAPALVGVRSPVAAPLHVILEVASVELPTLLVTAGLAPINRLESPFSTATLEAAQLRRDQSVALARATEALPGVRSVTTGAQIAKPLIRGLSGQRVLVLDGGHRLEDYSWSDEDGPSVDARLAARVEVIRGPTSLLYGSDALGGVVNVIPEALPEAGPSGEVRQRTLLELSAASNNAETGTMVRYERGAAASGLRATLVGRRAASLHTPAGELDNTGFLAINGEAAWGIRRARGNLIVRLSHYGGEFRLLEAGGPPAIRSTREAEEGPVRKARDERLQVDAMRLAGAWRLEAQGQFQQHALVEVSDDANPAAGAGKETVAFDLLLNTVTLGLKGLRTFGEHLHAAFGVSGLRQANASRGPIALVPGGTTTNGAAFAVAEARHEQWSVLGGLRVDARSVDADPSTGLGFAGDSRRYQAVSGDLGVVYRPLEGLALALNAGRGWRAPNLFELYSNGPKLSEARYEIGDATLRTERGTNIEGSVRWQSAAVRGEVTVFRNQIDRYTYIAPTGQSISGLPVYRHRQTDARLTGGEASIEVDVMTAWTVNARVDGVRATDRATGSPLPLTPPVRTVVGAEWHHRATRWGGRTHAGIELVGVARQRRLAALDQATGGYTLLDLSAGFDRSVLGRALAIEVAIHNATNVSYRDFLSRYKAFALNPGRNIVVRVATDL
ncbi:MAG: TonB-dependent receptor [Gemmatimonadota bacterium]